MTLQLNDMQLLRNQGYIDGHWVAAQGQAVFPVTNPATGETLVELANMGAAETEQAIEAAHRAFPGWRALPAKSRATILRRWYDLMLRHSEDLAQLMTAEQGKPLAEARGEVAYGASFVEWFAEEAKRAYGTVIPAPMNDRRLLTLRQPVGVCAAITPWNFPMAMITRKVAPALAAGCTVVCKPAEATPLTALALAVLADQAGIPPGVLNMVVGDAGHAAEIGEVLCASPIVRKLSFTGSTEVGRILMRQSADTIKRLRLNSVAMHPSLFLTMPTLMPQSMGRWPRNSGTPGKPACVPTVFTFKTRFMRALRQNWQPKFRRCRLARATRRA